MTAVLTSDQKGAIAETAVVHAAAKMGIDVYLPVMDGSRCDLILDIAGRLVRVQCKWANRVGAVVAVRCYSSRRTGTGFTRRSYTPAEIDALVAFCPELDRCYYLPLAEFGERREIQLRLTAPRNNQRVGINWAEEYELTAKLSTPGAVAQLGERVAGSHEVRGSSPLGSIPGSTTVAGANPPNSFEGPVRVLFSAWGEAST